MSNGWREHLLDAVKLLLLMRTVFSHRQQAATTIATNRAGHQRESCRPKAVRIHQKAALQKDIVEQVSARTFGLKGTSNLA
jgi:hypothetical protein